MSCQIAKVAVENAAYSFDDAFDYAIPEALRAAVQPGVRVLVPFGSGNKKRQGMVFALREKKEEKKLKFIAEVLDEKPLLNNELLRLAVFLKDRTFCTLFEAAKALLPSGIGLHFVLSYIFNPNFEGDVHSLPAEERQVAAYLQEKDIYVKREKIIKDLGLKSDVKILETLCDKGILLKNMDTQRKIGDATIKMVRLTELYFSSEVKPKFTPKQKEVIAFLENVGTASVKEVCYFTGVTAAVISTLAGKQTVELFENEIFRKPKFEKISSVREKITLTAEQETAYNGLLSLAKHETAATALLFGVTGSGKTQVFLKLIDAVIEDRKSDV